MPYTPLQLDHKAPESVKKFVSQQLDMLFADVHAMLRLPFVDMNGHGGCNFAAANTLLSLVSGLGTLLAPNFDTRNDKGQYQSKKYFIEVLNKYYPWDIQPPTGNTIANTINHLYDRFRNPLAHSLGIRQEGNYWVHVVKEAAVPSATIAHLEKSKTPPYPSVSSTPEILMK
jgi:hypothetical protein